jgi:hypothetical protein
VRPAVICRHRSRVQAVPAHDSRKKFADSEKSSCSAGSDGPYCKGRFDMGIAITLWSPARGFVEGASLLTSGRDKRRPSWRTGAGVAPMEGPRPYE